MYLSSELITSWKTKVSEQTQNSRMHVTKRNQSSMTINQSMRKSHMWGPAKTRFSFAQINSMNSII